MTPPEGDSGGTAARGSGSIGSGAADHAGSGSASGGSFRWAGQGESSGASAAGKLYRVAYTFQGMEEDSSQLSLYAGDLVRVQCRDPSGWTYGRLECPSGVGASSMRRTVGDAGWFPEALLEGEGVEGVSTDEYSSLRTQSVAEDAGGGAGTVGMLGGLGGLSVCREGAQDELLSEPTATPTVPQACGGGGDSSLFGFGGDVVAEHGFAAVGEGARLQECEQKLAQSANVRRRTQAAWETAQISSAEAEQAVETAERVLASLETQERRCKAEAIAVAGSSSQSLKSNWEAKLQLLEQKKEVVSATLGAARDRLEVEKGAADAARTRLRSEKHAAAAALDAVSRQRGRAKASLQGGTGSPGSSATAPSGPPAASRAGTGSGVSPSRAGVGFGRGSSAAYNHQRPGGRATSPPRRPTGSGGSSVVVAPRSEAASPCERSPGTRTGARSHSPNVQPREHRGGGARTPLAPGGNRGAWGAPGSATTPLRSRPTAAAARPDSRARVRPSSQSPGPQGSGSRRDAAPAAAQDEVACALEALQAAEALQAKLSAMPAHLREPVMRHCEALRGLLGQQTREALGAQTRDILAAPIPGAP